MVEFIRENTLRTKSMVMVNMSGVMVTCIKGNGLMENRMDMVSTFTNNSSFDMANGMMDKGLNGLMISILLKKSKLLFLIISLQ
jgi:hypothetical protein